LSGVYNVDNPSESCEKYINQIKLEGKKDEVLAFYKKACDQKGEFCLELGKIEMEHGHIDAALDAFEKQCNLLTNPGCVLFEKYLFVELGKAQKAMKETDPESVIKLYRLEKRFSFFIAVALDYLSASNFPVVDEKMTEDEEQARKPTKSFVLSRKKHWGKNKPIYDYWLSNFEYFDCQIIGDGFSDECKVNYLRFKKIMDHPLVLEEYFKDAISDFKIKLRDSGTYGYNSEYNNGPCSELDNQGDSPYPPTPAEVALEFGKILNDSKFKIISDVSQNSARRILNN